MTQIDRRSLITAAGGGLLLGACAHSENRDVRPYEKRGPCELFGKPVTATEPSPMESITSFDPDYLCILYIRFEANQTLTVRSAYVTLPSLNDIETIATPILKIMRRNEHATITAHRKEENFARFSFSHQHVLLIFVDNEPNDVGFDDRNGLDYIIRFTKFSSNYPEHTKIHENNAFFNIIKLELSNHFPLKSNIAYTLDFWNTDEGGREIPNGTPNRPNTHYLFSMNIHLKMAVRVGTTTWVPLILDPDTGNMGYEP